MSKRQIVALMLAVIVVIIASVAIGYGAGEAHQRHTDRVNVVITYNDGFTDGMGNCS